MMTPKKNIYAKLIRFDSQRHETKGVWYSFAGDKLIFKAYTLELPNLDNEKNISCILAGTYPVTKFFSHHLNRSVFLLHDVPGRSSIEVHPANYTIHPKQLLGCIAVGDHYADINGDNIDDIANSTATFDHLYRLMPDKFMLTISEQFITFKEIDDFENV